MQINPLYQTDSYKHTHRKMILPSTTHIFSHCTPRSNKYLLKLFPDMDNKYFVFGVQYVVKKLFDNWNKGFFNTTLDKALAPIKDLQEHFNWSQEEYQDAYDKFYELLRTHNSLPIEIQALEEGSVVDVGTPIFTITNTDPNYAWLTNFLESYLLSEIFMPVTVATICRHVHNKVKGYFDLASDIPKDFAQHCFSYRGHQNTQVSAVVGMAYALYNKGSDTIASIPYMREYYGQKEVNVFSIAAGEHSVCTQGILMFKEWIENLTGNESINKLSEELVKLQISTDNVSCALKVLADTACPLITKAEMLNILRFMSLYPTQPLAYVADSFDFWSTVQYLPLIKQAILARPTTAPWIIRPDSSDPVDVLLGNGNSTSETEAECVGLLQYLKQVFGTTTNSKGYEVLAPQIRVVYGDGINMDRMGRIYKGMTEDLNMSPENVCLALGAYILGNITRDSLGFAVKASYSIVNGELQETYKDPKTDPGKRSFKGRIAVTYDPKTKQYQTFENVTEEYKKDTCVLKTVKPIYTVTFTEIQQRLLNNN